MTIEQLKHRQQELNHNLLSLLDTQRLVVNKITGSNYSPTESPIRQVEGFIDEICWEQERTHELIKELRDISQKLIEHTFCPSEAIGI